MRKFVRSLGYENPRLRGDGEPPLQALLEQIAQGVPGARVEPIAPGEHQAIGSVERAHRTIGDQIRVLAERLREVSGVTISPKSAIFAWMIRHAVYIVNRYLRKADGTTAHLRSTGQVPKTALAEFGEMIHFRHPDPERYSKATARWGRGIWVGVLDETASHVIIDHEGAHITRCVKRLTREERWDKASLEAVRCKPWQRRTPSAGPPVMLGRQAPIAVPMSEEPPPPPPERDEEPHRTEQPAASPNRQSDDDEAPLGASSSGSGVMRQPRRAADDGEQSPSKRVKAESPRGETRPHEGDLSFNFDSPPKRGRIEMAPDGDGMDEEADERLEYNSSDTVRTVCGGIYGMEEAAQVYMTEEQRLGLRWQELEKLQDLGCYEVVMRDQVPAGLRIFSTKWVDTLAKSRLTVRDLKAFGRTDEITFCPTPSAFTNAALEWKAVEERLPMLCFDVVSAFPHADEALDTIMVVPPLEWTQRYREDFGLPTADPIWKMKKALYGRRSAGANFFDHFERVVTSIADFKRGIREPCLYHSKSLNVVLTHHVDDGRMVGPPEICNTSCKS